MIETHPYREFIPKKPRAMIIGTFPIAKFSDPRRRSEIKPHEFDFPFGGEKNLLWKLLGACFNRTLSCREDIVELLEEEGLALGDLIRSCSRKNGGSSDSDLQNITWNTDLLSVIKEHEIRHVYFTSRKVETWFKRLFGDVPQLKKTTLISPSAQSARSIVRMPSYLKWKKSHRNLSTKDFLIWSYKKVFKKQGFKRVNSPKNNIKNTTLH